MNNISISDLKTNPASVISKSSDYPVAIQKRNKTQAYMVGKDLFEKLVSYIEDTVDRKAVEKANFKKGRDFEDIASELGI